MTECDSVAYDRVSPETWQMSDPTKGSGSMTKTPTFVASAAREG
jgi:hypothetical protein